MALGAGSQYIVVVPAFDMVLVTTGGNDYGDKQPAILAALREHLLPGLT